MTQSDALAAFARWVIASSVFEGDDLSGMDIQDKATELGLLTLEPYAPPKHGPIPEVQPGDEICVFSAILAARGGSNDTE